MRLKKNAYWWAAASLLLMIFIFVFSSFPAEQSAGMSGSFLDGPLALLERWFGVSVSPEVKDVLHNLLRKAAHLLIFVALGVCVANTVRHFTGRTKRVLLISLCWCSFYAFTDELHQHFVPGRAAMWQDWALDTAGALIGIGAVLLFLRRKRRREN